MYCGSGANPSGGQIAERSLSPFSAFRSHFRYPLQSVWGSQLRETLWGLRLRWVLGIFQTEHQEEQDLCLQIGKSGTSRSAAPSAPAPLTLLFPLGPSIAPPAPPPKETPVAIRSSCHTATPSLLHLAEAGRWMPQPASLRHVTPSRVLRPQLTGEDGGGRMRKEGAGVTAGEVCSQFTG